MSEFLNLVNEHEQMWGDVQYPGRPPMVHINMARVVVFWIDETNQRPVITVHQNATGIKEYFAMLARRLPIGYPNRRLYRVFVQGREVRVKLRVGFEVVEESL